MVIAMRREMENHLWLYAAMALMIAISFPGGVVTYRLVLWMGFQSLTNIFVCHFITTDV
jgi:hypothetical protein